MDSNQLLAAGASLLGTLIGGLLVYWTQARDWRRSRRASAEDREAEAIQTLLVKALSLDVHAHQLALAAKVRGSLDGTVFALLGDPGPIDAPGALRAMTAEVDALQQAATYLWMSSDPRTVDLANEVSNAAAEVISAHTARRRLPALLQWFLDALRGPRLGDAAAIKAARAKLGDARTSLVEHTRQRFGLDDLSPTTDASDVPARHAATQSRSNARA